MSNYSRMCDAKLRLAQELINRGWEVKGYHASYIDPDPGADYSFNQGYWDGIAVKNGFVLVVNNRYPAEAKEIKQLNPKGNLSFDDRKKLEMLESKIGLWATEGEEKNGKELIEKIKSKVTDEPKYEIVGYTIAHLGNPKGSIWHIEKDGKIYDKGNSLSKFADVPEIYEFDINKMEYIDKHFTDWKWVDGEHIPFRAEKKLSDEARKTINDFKALILRFERVVNSMNGCGDGTKETEQKAQEQQVKEGYEKVTVKKYKEEIQVNEIEKPSEIKEGMYFKLKVGFNHGCSKGTVYKINSVKENPYNHKFYIDANRMNRKLNKALTGNATSANSFDVELLRLTEWIDKGSIVIVELVTVNTPHDVEKWVKIDKSKKANNTTKKSEQEKTQKDNVTEQTQETKVTILNHEITITADTDTRDNTALWVVKLVNKIDYDEFKKLEKNVMNPIKGYYSRFKGGFIFKYDPTSVLKPEIKTPTEQQSEEVTETKKSCNEVAESIIDKSTEFITELNIDGSTIADNEEYKTKMFDFIQNNNINITSDIISYLKSEEYCNNLIKVLEIIQSGYYQPIHDGFMYDCHFKAYDIPMNEIKQAVTALNISFIDMDCKIGFAGITAEQARQVKEISDINGSIFFIDAEMSEEEYNRIELEMQRTTNNNVTSEQSQNIHVTEITSDSDSNSNVINIEDYKNNSEVDGMQNINNDSNSNDFNVDDILTQFDNIEINNNSRISKEDEIYCKEQESQYNDFIKYSNDYLQYLKEHSIVNSYYNSLLLENGMNETRENKKKSFIESIVYYFKNKYKVTLTSDAIVKKYFIDINYNTIVTEIIDQLGGYSFTDKADKELKDEFKNAIKHNKLKLGNQKISIDSFFYVDSWNAKYKEYSVSYSYDEKFNKLFKAFSHFLYKSYQSDFRKLYDTITTEKNENLFKTHEITDTGITALKLYKNGKIDIEFSSNEYMRQFAKEYCGYIEKAS